MYVLTHLDQTYFKEVLFSLYNLLLCIKKDIADRVIAKQVHHAYQVTVHRVLRKFEDIFQNDTKCLTEHLDFIKLWYFNLERVSYKIQLTKPSFL